MTRTPASGRFLLRVPPALHQALRRQARAKGTSLNRYCRGALEAAVAAAREIEAPATGATGAVGGATSTAQGGTGAHERGGGRGRETVWRRAATAIAREVGADLEAVVLFGSRARGHDGPGSDVDLLLAVGSAAPLGRERYAAWDQRLAGASEIRSLGARVSPHFARLPAEPPGQSEDGGGALWLEVALHGIVLWQRTPAPSQWIGDARERMAAGVLRRRLAHGQPYWTCEPQR